MPIELSDDQYQAVQKMHNGCVLCGSTGAGKSRTSLAYYYKTFGGKLYNVGDEFGSVRLRKDVQNVDILSKNDRMTNPCDLYIITTPNKRDTDDWNLEMAIFGLNTDPMLNTYSNHVFVDSWNNIKKYVDVAGAFFIFDEQRAGGRGVWAKTFVKIARKNRWILASATPGDKWEDYIPLFLANNFYKNRTEFTREHFVYSRFAKYPKVTHVLNEGKLIKKRNSIIVNMEYKNDVSINKFNLVCDYDKKLYKQIMKSRFDPFKKEPVESASELCYLLRKVVNTHVDRIRQINELIQRYNRVLIFYNYDYELGILKEKGDWPDDWVIAERNGHKHDELPRENKWAYLVQYASGAEAWNCITTNVIIFYSYSYSYRNMVQAMGRINRRNTLFKDLYYYFLTSYAPIDIGITRSLKCKKNFNEANWLEKHNA